jgi:hypothetical protein
VSEPSLYTIDWVGERLTRGVPRWVIHKVDEDGQGLGHIFAKDTLEWRAAEYGLDDVDELLDMVLHEPHLPDEPDRDDAALRAGFITSTRPGAEPITLFNAASTTDALAAHRLRIADVKKARARVSPAKGRNPLDAIRSTPGITPVGLRAKRELVDTHRWRLVYGGLPVPVFASSSVLEVPGA